MYLVQIFLPLYDNAGQLFPRALFQTVRAELTEHFRGLTAHTRAPAEGFWKDEETRTTRDDIVIYEVMTDELDTEWWQSYRRTLEARFRQEQVVLRAQQIRLL
jgi:hypothetical protein